MTASVDKKPNEYLYLFEENKKQKKKIEKLTDQMDKYYLERKELTNKQMQDVKIKFELEEKVNRLKSKVKNLKMESKDSLSGNSTGVNILLEINLKTDNSFKHAEDVINFIKELQESKISNSKRENFKHKKWESDISDKLREDNFDTIDKYKLENKKLKEQIKEKNKDIDNYIVEIEMAKSDKEKLTKLNIRDKEKEKKLEEYENKLESFSDEIRKKDKRISDLENKINSITEETSSSNKTVDTIREENKSLKNEKLEKDKVIESLKKEKRSLIETHEKEIAKKQNALDAMILKLDNLTYENTDLKKNLETFRRENQSTIESKNSELEEKRKDLASSKSQIQNLESKVNELKSIISSQKKEMEINENEIKTNKNEKINPKLESIRTYLRPKLTKKKIPAAPPGARGDVSPCPNCHINYFLRDLENHLEECVIDS